MKILHTADLHIGAELSYLGETRTARKYEVLEVFKSITELCKAQQVEICLIAGDLFDSNSAAKEFFEPVIRAVEETPETRFFYVAGNHDPLDAASPFMSIDLPENLTVFGGEYETVEIEELKARITGRSFTHSSMEFKPSAPIPKDEYTNILLLHSDFGAAGSSYNPIPHEFVQCSDADYIALGHIHKRTAVERIDTTFIAYPGCPEGQGFDEAGEKGVYLGELSKGFCDLKFIPCSKRLHVVKKVDASSFASVPALAEGIVSGLRAEFGEDFGRHLYKLILTGEVEQPERIVLPELTSLLESSLYFVKLKNRISQKVDLNLLAGELSLRGVFVKKMLERIENSEGEEQIRAKEALYLGLKAFDSEVVFDED